MVTSKSLKSKSFMFGTLNPGAVLTCVGWRGEGKVITHNEGIDSRLCFKVDKYPFCMESSEWNDNNILLTLMYQDDEWYVNPKDVTEIKIPAMKKEFRAQAVAGSVWRFTKDWVVDGYHDDSVTHVIPKGTAFKIKDNKMSYHNFDTHEETCLKIHDSDVIGRIFPGQRNVGCVLPAKEVAQYIELVSSGKTKTYWVVENNAGERLLQKRFKGLKNVEASIRVRVGIETNDGNDDIYIPEWLSESDNYMTKLQLDNGLWAVEYDYMSDKELQREDMLEYYTIRKMVS